MFMCFLGDRNTFSVPSSFPFFVSLYALETVGLHIQHNIHKKIRFANVATVTNAVTITSCTRVTKRHLFQHPVRTMHKLTDVYNVQCVSDYRRCLDL
jgi:hypothetical protein